MLWILANWDTLLLIVSGVISVASVIAKLTPSEVDNNVIGYILKFIDMIALNKPPTKIIK